MNFVNSYKDFVFEKKGAKNTAAKVKDAAKKQKKAVKKVKDLMKKDKENKEKIKDGDSGPADKMSGLLLKVQTQSAMADVQKAGIKKKELELKSKLDTIKKSEKAKKKKK